MSTTRKTLFALGVSAQALAFCAAPASGQAPKTVIHSDYGGVVSEYRTRWKIVAIDGGEVEIRGPCYSACTLVTAAVPKDRICFSRYATLGFHLVEQGYRGVMPYGRGPPAMEATQWMLDQYPKDIREWIEVGASRSCHTITMSGRCLLPIYGRWVTAAARSDG